MKHIFFLVPFLLMSFASVAQQTDTEINRGNTTSALDKEPSFPNGIAGWMRYFEKNSGDFTPSENGAPKGTYVVTIKFMVKAGGKISDIKAQTKHGYGMEEKVIEVIRRALLWEPGIKNGKPVNAYLTLPVTFVVE
jgi:Gram-negative bacterial TonB protein C-terminal